MCSNNGDNTRPGKRAKQRASYRPDDYSDVGQAKVLVEACKDCLCYTEQTDYLYYDGIRWREDKLSAQKLVQELTDRQLQEATDKITRIMRTCADDPNLTQILATRSRPKYLAREQAQLCTDYDEAVAYHKFALQRRNAKYITAALTVAAPRLALKVEQLDQNGFLLNTPYGTYDLRNGLGNPQPHNPGDYITQVTAVSPGADGNELWTAFLQQIFCGDEALIRYIQMVCGLIAIGHVYVEAMIVAVGNGRNGKSTFFNVISKALGTYSGNLSADVLTQECRRNAKPELALLRGKRLVIAAELKSGTSLNDSMIKQLCSTDAVYAEEKYRAPFSFAPSHTLVLYTNHLPTVSANDDGIWRRLIVVPFNARIEGDADIKNFADYLLNHAGSAILSWIITGAKSVIDEDYKLPIPKCVANAINEYRYSNDWFAQFLDACCTVDPTKTESSSHLYSCYRDYCIGRYETPKSTTAFYSALSSSGFRRVVHHSRSVIVGLAIKYS